MQTLTKIIFDILDCQWAPPVIVICPAQSDIRPYNIYYWLNVINNHS